MNTPLDNGRFRMRLRNREAVVGTFAGLGSPLAAEVMASAGVDFVLVDCEHGSASDDVVYPTVVATGAYAVPTLVRVESGERIRIGRALDSGAAGVMIPRVEGVEEVREVLRHFDYPPTGDRGVATYNRSAQWGRDLSSLAGERDAAAIIQIETLGALAEVEAIAAIDGVDLLFVGPLDLSFALGVPREFDHPDFLAALDRVLAAANTAGIAAGILAATVEAAQAFSARGFEFIALSSDSVLLSTAISTSLTELRRN